MKAIKLNRLEFTMRKLITIVSLLVILLLSACNLGAKDEPPAVTVLMYHHFAEGEATSVTVDPELFVEQLITLKDAGFETITEHDLLLYLQGEEIELPERPLVITIDDGYLSNYELAYPILQELEMHATIYVVGKSRGTTPGSIPHFTWDEAREMYESGWIDIQSHTHDLHHRVETAKGEEPALVGRMIVDGVEESEEEFRERIRNDLLTSKNDIENYVGNEVFTFTYPYGVFNETVIEIARELGYELMYTVREGVTRFGDSPYEINRINADGNDSGDDLLRKIDKHLK